jgi:carotenoid cleavage dioxygenase-like enzyme
MMQELIIKGNGIGTTMSWNTDNPLYFRVIEKSTGNELPIKYEADPMGFVHTFNAYEEDGYIGGLHVFEFSSVGSRDSSQAEIEITVCKPELIHKMTNQKGPG